MSEEVRVRQIGHGEWSAEIFTGQDRTDHRVVWSDGLAEDLEVTAPEGQIAVESVRYLLDREVGTALPHDIVLDDVSRAYQDFIPELRQRLLA
jgi:hypothetical protein